MIYQRHAVRFIASGHKGTDAIKKCIAISGRGYTRDILAREIFRKIALYPPLLLHGCARPRQFEGIPLLTSDSDEANGACYRDEQRRDERMLVENEENEIGRRRATIVPNGLSREESQLRSTSGDATNSEARPPLQGLEVLGITLAVVITVLVAAVTSPPRITRRAICNTLRVGGDNWRRGFRRA